MGILNWKLMSHPMNYLTILVMALLAGVFGHLVLTLAGMEPASKRNGQSPSPGTWAAMPAGQAPGEDRAGAISPQMASIATNATY